MFYNNYFDLFAMWIEFGLNPFLITLWYLLHINKIEKTFPFPVYFYCLPRVSRLCLEVSFISGFCLEDEKWCLQSVVPSTQRIYWEWNEKVVLSSESVRERKNWPRRRFHQWEMCPIKVHNCVHFRYSVSKKKLPRDTG